MIKRDLLKLVLYLLSFSILISCSSTKKRVEDWTHFFEPCNFGVTHETNANQFIVKQRQRNDCWFASYIMLKSWKDQTLYDYNDVKQEMGSWKYQIKRNLGLWVEEQPNFIKDMNLGFYPPANYTYEGFVQLLDKHGPLMICMGASGFNHARILFKVECGEVKSKTIFHMINPNKGKIEKWNAYDFFKTFESEAQEIVEEHEGLTEDQKKRNEKMNLAWRYQVIFIE